MHRHTYATRNGGWTAESEELQGIWSFDNLYRWLEIQHARMEPRHLRDQVTNAIVKRYKLPFKTMNVPPRHLDLFKWRKGAQRLSCWMESRGLAPIDPGIIGQQQPRLVAPPPLQSKRENARQRMWARVASKAKKRGLASVGVHDHSSDATLTRDVIGSVMTATRGLTEAEASELEKDLESEMLNPTKEKQIDPLEDDSGVVQLLSSTGRATCINPLPIIDMGDLNAVMDFLMA